MRYWVQDRIVRQHRHKCSRTEIKQSIFDKSHISWECFGNVFLEMTKEQVSSKKPQSEKLSGIPWGRPSFLSNCGTLCQQPTIAGAPCQSSLHKSPGALSRLESPIDLKGIFFIQVALIEGISSSDSGRSCLLHNCSDPIIQVCWSTGLEITTINFILTFNTKSPRPKSFQTFGFLTSKGI